MSREIKFRLWDKKPKMMINWEYILQSDYLKDGLAGKYPMMQFTGLKDKNGNEIYEGDIVTHLNRLYEVAINFNGYYLQRYKLWRGKFKPSYQYCLSLITKPFKNGERGENGGVVDCAEIIGNIYETPKLISKII